jgi:hypothetical protein
VGTRVRTRRARLLVPLLLAAGLLVAAPVGTAQGAPPAAPAAAKAPKPKFTAPAGFDVSAPMREVAKRAPARTGAAGTVDAERGAIPADRGFKGDGAVQSSAAAKAAVAAIAAPSVNFEGITGPDNIPILGGIPIPPDPDGDVGPNHYVQMVNTAWAVYTKTGTRLLGPLSLASLWAGFEVPDCEDNSGDPIVLHDQLADRWILTQFTTAGLNVPAGTFYNCVAVSTTPDPTGSYYRYAFSTGPNFPDYPKYGVWPNAYFVTTREFGQVDFAGIGVYALERAKMIRGNPTARAVSVLVPPGDQPWITGDGWLPSDWDGNRRPPAGSPNYIVGTQDDEGPYGAPFDAINLFKFGVSWGPTPTATFSGPTTLPVAEFDSIYPCTPPGSRNCIPQPDTSQNLDILSYRQRPTWRLAYRNFGTGESLVTSQSVEARPGIAGMRWYELRRPGNEPIVYQQGTYAPADDLNRWMGSIAQDKRGNMALGYSVSSETTYPGIRYTGRLRNDVPNQMPQGEGTVVEGSGSQTDPAARWGDYTAMHIDPVDNCRFWYINQYYAVTSARGWQTRIAAFRMPGCT